MREESRLSRTADTRGLILESAQALFMERGIRDTSIADVAAAAGLSKGTLFYHFRSKDDLVREIAFGHVERISAEVLAIMGSDRGGDPAAHLERFLRAMLQATVRNKLHLYLIEESITRNEELRASLQEKYREWLETLVGALMPYLGERAAKLGPVILAMTDGLVIQACLGLPPPQIASMLEAIGL